MIPPPWVGLVLALAVFRLCRLAGWDDFPPIARARVWLTGEQAVTTGDSNAQMRVSRDPATITWTWKRPLLAAFLACPYCIGFWISLAALLAWRFAPTATLYAAGPLALSGAVGIIARRLDP